MTALTSTEQAIPATSGHPGVLAGTLPFAVAMTVPLLGLAVAAAPSWQRALALPLVVFGLLPVLDLVVGRERRTLVPEVAARKGRDLRFDVWLWVWIPLQILAVVGIFWRLATDASLTPALGAVVETPTDVTAWAPVLAFVLLALSTGLMTGIGINVAHELMHRRGRPERAGAEILMVMTTYTHFCVEHVLGHHKHVSTPVDPASSRLGESIYVYLPRTLLGGLRSAWRLEGQRVRRVGIPSWSLRNRRLRYALTLLAVYVFIGATVGAVGVVFMALQSAVAMLLLETINFIEHYGLARREIRPGVYERTMPAHSWNASERMTNWFLFHLQRHADHHHLASRPFFALRHIDDSPQMPTGYAGMILLALVPPLWRRVMDPRVLAWQARQVGEETSSSAG